MDSYISHWQGFDSLRLPGCTLDILKLLRKLEQLLVLFLRLLHGERHRTVNI